MAKTQEHKQRISKGLEGHSVSQSLRLKISKTKTGRKINRKINQINRPIDLSKKRAGPGQCNCPCGCTASESSKWHGGKGVRQQCGACYMKASRAGAGCTCSKL